MSYERAGCGPREGISGRRSLLAARVYQEARQSRHRIAPSHDRSIPVRFPPVLAARSGRRGQRPWTWRSSAPLPVGQVPRQIRWRTRHRFRRLRNRGGSRRLPAIGRARQAVAPTAEDARWRARCRREQFVSGPVRASGRVLVNPDVTIPRPFAGTRPGYPPADSVCGG